MPDTVHGLSVEELRAQLRDWEENEVAAFGFKYLYDIPGMEDVEDVIVLPDDLLGAISLDCFRPCVPAGHVSIGIEHVDRMVGDRADQQPEPRLVAEGTGKALRPRSLDVGRLVVQ